MFSVCGFQFSLTFSFYLSPVAGCAVIQPWEGLVIGLVAGVVCQMAPSLLNLMHVDDPVGAVAVHGIGGMWVSVL